MTLSPRLKQILLIVLFIATSIFMIWIVYYVFFRPQPIITTTDVNQNVNQGVLPDTNTSTEPTIVEDPQIGTPISTVLPSISSVARGGDTLASQLTDGGVVQDPVMYQGDFRYYDPTTGSFYILNANGEKVLLSDRKFMGVEEVEWAKVGDKVILTFLDGTKIVYDFATDQQTTLPPDLEEVKFSGYADQIGFEYVGSGNNKWLGVSSPDNSNMQYLISLAEEGMTEKLDVNWSPNSEVVATINHGETATTQKVYLVGKNDENFSSIPVNGLGFESQWSPSGKSLLYNVYSPETGYKPALYIARMIGGNVQSQFSLGVYTWQDKCVFEPTSESAIYCAVPNSLPEQSGILPDLNTSSDSIYKIDLTSGVSSLIAAPVNSSGTSLFYIENIYLSSDGSILYFKDSGTGQIYSINLS